MKYKILITLLLCLLISPVLNVYSAQAPTPGSSTDPVITKSYFDQNSLTEAKVNQLIAAAIANQPNSGNVNAGANTPDSNAITIIQLRTGQTLYAGAGAEFIVRTGKTIAVSNDEDGIPDVTAGKDIPAGTAIVNNHLLVFPRDTRGIKPDPKNTADIYVMVRGTYLLMNADGTKAAPVSP